MCSHLFALLEKSGGSAVKLEPQDDNDRRHTGSPSHDDVAARNPVHQRFIEVVGWGAVTEGVKRRKVRPSIWPRRSRSQLAGREPECSCSQTNEGLTSTLTQASPPECHTCSSTLSHPWACLTCSYIGCLPLRASTSAAGSKDCMSSHWQASSGHCRFGGYRYSAPFLREKADKVNSSHRPSFRYHLLSYLLGCHIPRHF